MYSYSKFEVPILIIHNNTYDVVGFDRLSITQHIHESLNKYDSLTNNDILTTRLCIFSARFSVLFLLLWTLMSKRLMNQTYFERYEFDVKVVNILIATCSYEINVVVSMNESKYIIKFQCSWLIYLQNFMSAYD